MDLSVLIALLVGLQALEGPSETVEPVRALAGTAAAVLVVVALCRIAADRAIAAVEERDGDALLRSGRFIGTWPFLGWLACVFAFDWGAFVALHVPRTWFVARHVALLVPLAVMYVAAWTSARRVEAQFSARAPTSWDVVRRALGRNALILVPMFALMVVQDGLATLEGLDVPAFRRFALARQAFQDVDALVVFAVMATVAWFAPSFVRRAFRAKPLPAGELRTEIERLTKQLGVSARDLLVWDTGGRVMNALVVGLTSRSRYVIVSDALIATLPTNEVLAVVAHEAGHAKLRHIPTYFLISVAAMLLVQSIGEAMVPGATTGGEIMLNLAFLGFFWFGLVGWLSRRFERQADVFGAAHAGDLVPDAPPVAAPGHATPLPYGTATMVAALERVVSHNGAGPSYRHGSVDDRTAFLAAYATDPLVRTRFERDTKTLRRSIRGFVALAVVLTALRVPGGLERGHAAFALADGLDLQGQAETALAAGKTEEATPLYERAHPLFVAAADRLKDRPSDVQMKAIAAQALYSAGDVDLRHRNQPEAARKSIERSLALALDVDGHVAERVGFEAYVDLGLLALRLEPDPAKAIAEAKKKFAEADALPSTGELHDARLRLLSAAIRARDPDPAIAQRGQTELKALAGLADRPQYAWKEIAADAAKAMGP